MSFESVLHGLRTAGVEFVVVGGVAATAHGSARFTRDVDICYASEEANRERLALLLRGWSAWLRGGAPDLPFVLDARTLKDVPVLTLVTREGWLDVMDRVAGVGDYGAVLGASTMMELFGVPARVLSLDALIAAKRATGRRKDHEALLELEALREERRKRGL